jgi:hypothetical protein
MHRAVFAPLAAILLSIVLMTACAPNAVPPLSLEPSASSDACPAIASATSVQVLLPPGTTPLGKSAYLITDPERVRKLEAFVNLRRNVSPAIADTPPSPKLRATFYYGGTHVAIFGSGPGVFYLQCGTVRGTRSASPGEIVEFEYLIAPPDTAP